jgi:ferric-dicitrate binding protein FerR (iron transport regulator)
MDRSAPAASLLSDSSRPARPRWRQAFVRLLWAAAAAAVAYAAWRGYQNPNFLLDLASFRLC